MSDDTPDLQSFPFQGVDGEQYELPDIRMFSPRQLQAASRGDLDKLEMALVDNGADPASVEAFMSLPFWRINQLIAEWVQGADAAGKPSPSSPSTATPSKRISKSGGSRSRR